MLKITNLRKKYKNFPVLKGLNMNLQKGDVYGFLGKNGCGKTTTMNIICNIVGKDEGKIEFANETNKAKIGYLTETPALYGYMNGYEYLKFIASCANYAGDVDARIAEVLQVTGMTEGACRRIKGYSRGMNQRLGIAAAMFDHPELLILDEPTSALDPEGRAEVMEIIRGLKADGATIILCTHIITDVERVANRVGIMKDGVIMEEGAIDEIVTKYRSQSTGISVTLTTPDAAIAEEMRMLPSISFSDYNPVSGAVMLGAADAERAAVLYDELISLVYRKKIRISQMFTQKTTLEDIYFTITGSAKYEGGLGFGESQGGTAQ
ncbi:MAG: ABC transporter ATP-binding protein [Oscillospiraceae bacterium]|nr:ABC transporter ATP-binding protein [Oscillospiraceae bacterium]